MRNVRRWRTRLECKPDHKLVFVFGTNTNISDFGRGRGVARIKRTNRNDCRLYFGVHVRVYRPKIRECSDWSAPNVADIYQLISMGISHQQKVQFATLVLPFDGDEGDYLDLLEMDNNLTIPFFQFSLVRRDDINIK